MTTLPIFYPDIVAGINGGYVNKDKENLGLELVLNQFLLDASERMRQQPKDAKIVNGLPVLRCPDDFDYRARRFVVKQGKANIYLYRNRLSLYPRLDLTVELDGKVADKTLGGTCFLWEVDPGLHQVTSKAENTDSLSLDAEAGKSYFIWQEKFGIRSKLHRVDDQHGWNAVKRCEKIESGF